MKLNLDCEHYKQTSKSGQKDKCFCKFLNRNWHREMKYYQTFMKSLKRGKR